MLNIYYDIEVEILKHLNIIKILIILILLVVSVGSISAADDSNFVSDDNSDDDFDLDEELEDNLDDESDDDLDDEDFEDDESDDDLDDEDFEDDESDDDLYNESDDDWDDDLDDGNYTDFDYLDFKIKSYLIQYGNYSYFNWTESEHFMSEYQVFLLNQSNYTLNSSAEGYETYLKIFDSIISTFGDYNLTENETEYLKFMIIYYLNNFGNVSANFTWDENQSFANFTPDWAVLACCLEGCGFSGNATSSIFYNYLPVLGSFSPIFGNVTDSNSTKTNMTHVDLPENNPWWANLAILFLVVLMMFLIIL